MKGGLQNIMATLKGISISRNWGERPTGNVILGNMAFANVEKGQRYDLVQFSINELNKPYMWRESIGVPCGISEEEIKEIVLEYIEKFITDKDIKSYLDFLEMGEKWGWD